jgi:hypothetical protein
LELEEPSEAAGDMGEWSHAAMTDDLMEFYWSARNQMEAMG